MPCHARPPRLQAIVAQLRPKLCEIGGEAETTDRLLDAFGRRHETVRGHPVIERRYWKIAPGEQAWQWPECLRDGFIGIGWNELGDVSGIGREEFDARRDALIQEKPSAPGRTRHSIETVWRFSRIAVGDRIVANKGTTQVLGIGTVRGPYYFVRDAEHGHRLPVQWDDTVPRAVHFPGWLSTMQELDRRVYESVLASSADGPPREPASETTSRPSAPSSAAFHPDTFLWLSRLHETPRRDFYLANQDAIRANVEVPFQAFFRSVVRRLPKAMLDVVESEKHLFSRIVKNDWGQGGAWDHYWGAVYPRHTKRIAGVQLYALVDLKGLDVGFAMPGGDSPQRDRFLRNLKRHSGLVSEWLREASQDRQLFFGRRVGKEAGLDRSLDAATWLADPESHGIQVREMHPVKEAVSLPASELIERTARLFRDLFPLLVAAIDDDPALRLETSEEIDDEAPRQPAYPLSAMAAESGFDLETLESWVRAVERKRQAIFYGPPGTGKTWIAERLARHLVAEGDGFVTLVQFHPAYAYEDFIQGIRPKVSGQGVLSYELVEGRFLEFCREAVRRKGVSVLIVDEINRANLARVLGELMYLLEYRDRTVPLAGGSSLSIPDNIRILGTMNTADRSIALVDHALRRRFAFIEVRPEYGILERFHRGSSDGVRIEALIALLQEINKVIGDPHYAVGISFFLRRDLENEIEDVWRREIEPYLEEYFFDGREVVREFRWEKIRERVMG